MGRRGFKASPPHPTPTGVHMHTQIPQQGQEAGAESPPRTLQLR